MAPDWQRSVLGRTGRSVCRIGLACSYGADDRCVAMAFERGINYFYWGTFRRAAFGRGLRQLRGSREGVLVTIQSYSRVAALVGWSLERALRRLEMEYADVLLLGLWNHPPATRVLDAARRLRERGLVRYLALSTHHRLLAAKLASEGDLDILHVRYNAIHRGAEREIFPLLPPRPSGPGIVSFTATSWGQLLSPARVPPGDRVPTAADCYRFVLTNPAVDICLAGPKNAAQFQAALDALDRGPMDADELEWIERVGKAKYGAR
ncbi:MAG TPA: aldo/keto reductase [Bryobacteraceae bacterium]|jgi:aryl-alcohol dehydrogenase-like predicted oxidoreductase|nr:aldo/keto reductase [Bryobacteraceae bacterium]